jgi:hypothetical protein
MLLAPPELLSIVIIVGGCFSMGLLVGLFANSWAWHILALVCGVLITLAFVLVVLLPIVRAPGGGVTSTPALIAKGLLVYVTAAAAAFAGNWLGTLIVKLFLRLIRRAT